MTTTPFELYTQAGAPIRATVKLSEPTKIGINRRRATVKKEFDAWLYCPHGKNTVRYSFNRNNNYGFILPENTESITPIDIAGFWYRVRKAAGYIKRDQYHGRELDDAFENCDQEEVCAGLMRLARRSPLLLSQIKKIFASFDDFTAAEQKFSPLTDEELSVQSRKSRDAAARRSQELYG